ncbi:MAG TPA: serine hydrolase domain-containing protein [Mucilaginibacter sp.]|nr:serine hydrolase domain-containing protein [Mucilaginibacter sp.]
MKKAPLTLLLTLISSAVLVNARVCEKKINSLIQKTIRLNRFNGSVLVCKNGQIIYEKAFGYQDAAKKVPDTTSTVYQIGSATKEFTAGLILKLAAQNIIINNCLISYN